MEQPGTVEIGAGRHDPAQRSDRRRGRLTLLVVFVIGAVVGSAVVSALSSGGSDDAAPELSVSIDNVGSFGSTGELTVGLRVRNDGAEQVHIDRVSAETNGYALLYAAPRPPDGGPPLRVDPGDTGTVGLTLSSYCLNDGALNVTLLLVLAGENSAGQTLALPVPELDRRLAPAHRAACSVSMRSRDYSVLLRAARAPGWAEGRLLVADVVLHASGPQARGLELTEVRPHFPGVTAHFRRTDDTGVADTLADGIAGELSLRMRDCGQATAAQWPESWATHDNGVGVELYVEKPTTGAAVTVERNDRLLSRIQAWVDVRCSRG